MENLKNVAVSVLMLTHNRETMVGRAIDSILAQSFTDFELIIIDNGSADQSGKIAGEYAKKDERIRVFRRNDSNIGAGRNMALDMARGKYLTFIDDDDWAEPDFLEFLVKLLEEDNADVAICGAADKAFDEKKVMTGEEAVIELLRRKKYNMAFPTKMFTKVMAEKWRFPENSKYDDIVLMYKLLAKADRVAYHGLAKYTFYRHPGNHSAWTTNHSLLNAQILDEYLDAYRERTIWLSESFPESKDVFLYFELSFMISMVEKIERLHIRGCEKQKQLMVNYLKEHEDQLLRCDLCQPFEKEWLEKYIDKPGENGADIKAEERI